ESPPYHPGESSSLRDFLSFHDIIREGKGLE
ncbi:unnamed protein product, partial [marine sediment metagenome]